MSGLTAAHFLQDKADITLFEKARGVGGRLSTRRADPYHFDHGVQYFTARTPAFQDFIQPLADQGIIARWNARYVKFQGDTIIERKNWADEEPRYVGVPGMNSLPKYLSHNLAIHLDTRIDSLTRQGKWQLYDDKGQHYPDFDWVVTTIPSAQAAALLPASFCHHEAISAIKMTPCLALMLGFSEKFSLSFDAAHATQSDIGWLSVNSAKPGRADKMTLMIHSSETYGQDHINTARTEDGREKIIAHLMAETTRLTGYDALYDINRSDYKTLHGWLYANNQTRDPAPLFMDESNQLAACGDWGCGGRVEGAFTSAFKLAQSIKESL